MPRERKGLGVMTQHPPPHDFRFFNNCTLIKVGGKEGSNDIRDVKVNISMENAPHRKKAFRRNCAPHDDE